ncbi:MAG: hypothetical protein AAF438_13025 [Pseudomonadota bacterium]
MTSSAAGKNTKQEDPEQELLDILSESGTLRRARSNDNDAKQTRLILDEATTVCANGDLSQLEPPLLTKTLSLPVETFFAHRGHLIQALILRINYATVQIIRQLTNTTGYDNWLTAGPDAWDRYVGIFLENEELVACVGTLYMVPEYQQSTAGMLEEVVDIFLQKIEQAGFIATEKRRDVAMYSLEMSNFLRHLVITEPDHKSRQFLRKQAKSMIAGFLPYALTYE